MQDPAPYSCIVLQNPTNNLAEDVRRGLTALPRTLPCKYFYDAAGMTLFEKICALPEYYLTRVETGILRQNVAAIVDHCSLPLTLVELGSGCGPKTRLLLEACLRRQPVLAYYAVDLAPAAMADAARPLLREYPGLRFVGLAGEFADGLRYLENWQGPPRLVAFLGSTIGNFDEEGIRRFFTLVRQTLRPQDRFLLGFDPLKEEAILIPAYDDSQGVTAAFNRNLLVRLNRELGANFDVSAFAHCAVFNAARSRIEMYLVSLKDQTVRLPTLDLTISFRLGETIHTENCYKHSQEAMMDLVTRHGFRLVDSYSDERKWFSLYLLS